MLRTLLCLLLLFCLGPAAAGAQQQCPSPTVMQAVKRFVQAAQGGAEPRSADRAALAEFAQRGASCPAEPARYKDMPGAVHTFEVQADLQTILATQYNQDIPSSMIMPSSVRCSKWLEMKGQPETTLPDLADLAANGTKSVMLRGLEQETNTPDLFTGSYYTYRQHRLLYLHVPAQGAPFLLSVTAQKDRSEVGHKGQVLGEDNLWTYFYSGEKGVNKTGLGWVDSYIDDSAAVTLYTQSSSGSATRVTTLKWLEAGWLGMNMVKSKHIQAGLERFAHGLTTVLQSPKRPAPRVLARVGRWLADQPRDQLAQWQRQLAQNRPPGPFPSAEDELARMRDPEYTSAASHNTLLCAVGLEFMKCQLELPSAAASQTCRQIFDPVLDQRKGSSNATAQR